MATPYLTGGRHDPQILFVSHVHSVFVLAPAAASVQTSGAAELNIRVTA